MLIQQIQPVNAGPQNRPCSTCWDAHFLKMNADWKIWQLLIRRLSSVQEPGQTYDSVRRWWTRKKESWKLGTVCHFGIFPVPTPTKSCFIWNKWTIKKIKINIPCAFCETARLPSACTPLLVSEAPSAGPLKNIYAPAPTPFWSPPPPFVYGMFPYNA